MENEIRFAKATRVGAAFFDEQGKLKSAIEFTPITDECYEGKEQPRNIQDTLIDWRNLSFIKDYESKIPEIAKTIELIETYCHDNNCSPQDLIDAHRKSRT